MRLLFVISLTSLVAAAATFACSSGDSAATPADAGKDAKAVVKSDDDDDDKTTDPPPVTTDPDAGDPDASDAATTGTTGGDLVITGDGGVACDVESFREAETNNTAETANKLVVKDGTTKICGQVTSGDPDFFTFKMPDDSQNFFVTPSGNNFKISGTIDGQPFSGFDFNDIQINQGATWVVKVETTATDARPWRLAFKF